MVTTVPFDRVREFARARGMRTTYPGGGGFTGPTDPPNVAAWLTAGDATVLPRYWGRTRRADSGDVPALLARAAAYVAAEAVWLLPVHPWAAELEHGAGDVAGWVTSLGLPAGPSLADPAGPRALAFAPDDPAPLAGLWAALGKSDFTLLLPPSPVAVLLHHHRQLWFTCPDPRTADALLDL